LCLDKGLGTRYYSPKGVYGYVCYYCLLDAKDEEEFDEFGIEELSLIGRCMQLVGCLDIIEDKHAFPFDEEDNNYSTVEELYGMYKSGIEYANTIKDIITNKILYIKSTKKLLMCPDDISM